MTNREVGIESGVNNAMDTVAEKAMTPPEAFAMLSAFVSDGINCAGISDDVVTEEDMEFARALWFCPFDNCPDCEKTSCDCGHNDPKSGF